MAAKANKKNKKKTAAAHLADAEVAIRSSKLDRAVTALSAAWRVLQIDRIADVLDHVSAKMMPVPEPFKNEREWHATARQSKSSDLPRLLASKWPMAAVSVQSRIWVFECFDADPRIVRALLSLIKTGRFDSAAGLKLWQFVFYTLSEWNVAGAHDLVADIAGQSLIGSFPLPYRNEVERFRRLLEGTPRIEKPDQAALLARDKEAFARLTAIEEWLGISQKQKVDREAQRRALLDAVYESPNDDAPRLVLADFFAEENDPRGEFIQLDIRLANEGKLPTALQRRRDQLARIAGRSWCEGIDPALGMIELRRGFPGTCTVQKRVSFQSKTSSSSSAAANAHRTIERLCIDESVTDVRALNIPLHANFANVSRLSNISPPFLAKLLEQELPRHHFDRIDLSAASNWAAFTFASKRPTKITINTVGVENAATLRHLLDKDVLRQAKVKNVILEKKTTKRIIDGLKSRAGKGVTISVSS